MKKKKKPSDRIIEIATENWKKLPVEARDGYISLGKYGQAIQHSGMPIDTFIPRATMQYLDEVELNKKKTK